MNESITPTVAWLCLAACAYIGWVLGGIVIEWIARKFR